RDAGATLIVTDSLLAQQLPAFDAATVLVDPPTVAEPAGGARVVAPPAAPVPPGAAAYVVYTSGSTGRPKGVVIEHRGLTDLCLDHIGRYGVGPGDRASNLSTPGFDATVLETWPYLCAGAEVHIADRATLDDPRKLLGWIVESRITICC